MIASTFIIKEFIAFNYLQTNKNILNKKEKKTYKSYILIFYSTKQIDK